MSELGREELLEIMDRHTYMGERLNYGQWVKGIEQIKALIREDNVKRDMIIDNRLRIQKLEVTEEFIEEKAKTLCRMADVFNNIEATKVIIRSLIEEIRGK